MLVLLDGKLLYAVDLALKPHPQHDGWAILGGGRAQVLLDPEELTLLERLLDALPHRKK